MQNIGETEMIINFDREPIFSLYYLGGISMNILSTHSSLSLEELFVEIKKELHQELHIDFFYYTLDWLFLMSAICVNDGRVALCR